jgi:hypothetical protein
MQERIAKAESDAMNALQGAAEAKREIDGMTDRINDRINN